MEEKVYNADADRLTPRQQRLLLRAVVGSLVISAALAAPSAFGQAAPEVKYRVTESPKLNAKPFEDLLAKAARLHADGLIGWEDTFEVTFEADRAPDGSLHNLNLTSVAAVNGRWPGLMRELVSALSESRLLTILEDAERLNLTFKLDPRGAFASLNFETQSPKRAAVLQNAYRGLLQAAIIIHRGRPEEAIFRAANVTANGKQFAMTLQMPREQLGNLLRQSLALP